MNVLEKLKTINELSGILVGYFEENFEPTDINLFYKIKKRNENIQELSNSLNKGDNEMPKKIKLKYGQGSITYRTKEKRYIARYYKNGILQKPIYAKTQEEITNKLKNAIKNKDKIINESIKKSMLLSTWLNDWFNTYKKPFLCKSSLSSISTCINKYLIPLLGYYEVEKLNGDIIQKVLNNIEFPRQKEISYNVLNASLNKALQLNVTKNNYMLAVQKQKAKSVQGKALTTQEQTLFINALDNFKDYKNVFLAYIYTGTRRNELLNLKWEDIDFINDKINIKGTKTANAVRTIPLNDKLKDILLNMKKDKEYIFNFKPDTLNRTIFKIYDSINLKGFTIHSLRHTFATRCLENNITAKVVQQWLGHSKVNITLDIYTHIQTDFEKEQSKKINDIF